MKRTVFEEASDLRRSRGSLMPDDLLEEARRRLEWACILFVLAFSFAYFFPRLVFGSGMAERVGDAAAGIAMAIAALLAAAIRFSRITTPVLLLCGLGFEVIGSFAIAVSESWSLYSPAHTAQMPAMMLHGISWVCVWMIIFPALVPTKPSHAVLATLLSAPATPLVLAASHAYHQSAVEPRYLDFAVIGSSIANAIAAGLAIAVARVIHGLGRKVHEARRMGSYTLVERLGGGAMGEVWRAEHRLLARPAAVKLVRSELADGRDEAYSRALQRFEIEAQATASLRCPHTIHLYDFGVARDGRLYYVMELLDGIDLEALVERFGPVSPARAVHLLRQACLSLEEAHQKRLVHRDIKPANIMCCRYGLEDDFVKVLDFGVVRGVRPAPAQPRLTSAMSVIGTPAYLAPEMILGEHEPDARADLYALGCVAYWLLAGRLVFDADSPMRMAARHVETVPDPPSRFAPGVPPELDDAVLACLAKRPEERPPSAAALRERLSQCPLEEPWSAAHARDWWTRHGGAVAPAAQA